MCAGRDEADSKAGNSREGRETKVTSSDWELIIHGAEMRKTSRTERIARSHTPTRRYTKAH